MTEEDLATWKVKIEEPLMTTYKGIEVYKLQQWTQGPVMLQTLNILENFDLKSMGYNSTQYIHTLYQAMNLAFADRDFYYGDPAFPPEEPMKGLLSKEYSKERSKLINAQRNDADARPGDPYPFEGKTNPFMTLLNSWESSARNIYPSDDPLTYERFLDSFHCRNDINRGGRRRGLGCLRHTQRRMDTCMHRRKHRCGDESENAGLRA